MVRRSSESSSVRTNRLNAYPKSDRQWKSTGAPFSAHSIARSTGSVLNAWVTSAISETNT